MTPEFIAASAICRNGEIYVPQVQWIKEYPGQTTDGRIGRPAIRYGPVSWLEKEQRNTVRALIGAKQIY